jgi:hypothetical protein
MSQRLEIENDGQLILRTNYWELPEAQAGRCLVSYNSGAFRLLLPLIHEPMLREMSKAEGVVVCRGPWPEAGLDDAFEIRFDDGTDSPFSLKLGRRAFVNVPFADEIRMASKFTVWTKTNYGRPCLALELRSRYRFSPEIPDPRPWDEADA